jgi:hypothetical protein
MTQFEIYRGKGSKSHALEHEFKSWKKIGCRPQNVWNTKHGYNFGTNKYVDRRTRLTHSQVTGWDQVEGLPKSSCGIKTW